MLTGECYSRRYWIESARMKRLTFCDAGHSQRRTTKRTMDAQRLERVTRAAWVKPAGWSGLEWRKVLLVADDRGHQHAGHAAVAEQVQEPRTLELTVPPEATVAPSIGQITGPALRAFRTPVPGAAYTVKAKTTADAIIGSAGALQLSRVAPLP